MTLNRLKRFRSRRQADKWAKERLTCHRCGTRWDFFGVCACGTIEQQLALDQEERDTLDRWNTLENDRGT